MKYKILKNEINCHIYAVKKGKNQNKVVCIRSNGTVISTITQLILGINVHLILKPIFDFSTFFSQTDHLYFPKRSFLVTQSKPLSR